jgi:hypothetical protein
MQSRQMRGSDRLAAVAEAGEIVGFPPVLS